MLVLCLLEYRVFDIDHGHRVETMGKMFDAFSKANLAEQFDEWAKEQERDYRMIKWLPQYPEVFR